MKYKAKTKDCHLFVKAKASWGEEVDENALNAFGRIYLRGFLRPKILKKNVIEYSGPVGISLYERLKKPISKRDFLFIIEQVVLAVQKVQSNRLNLTRVIMDIRYVYINDVTKEIQFLYVPSSKEMDNPGVMEFLESIVYSAIPAADNDTEFVSRFIYFLKNQKGFNPDVVEKYVAKEDRSVVNTIKKQNAGQSGFMTPKKQKYYEHYNGEDDEGEEATGLLEEEDDGTEEATGLLEEDDNNAEEATGLLEEEDEATGLLNEEETGYLEEDGGEETGLLNVEEEMGTALLDDVQSVHYPELYRVLTGETISVNKPVFRLGKERSYVDYFVNNNNAVSRSHADVITRGNKYFVIDLNSKNHTYINDQMLAVQCETEIRDGDHLKLGNEEFIFRA